MVKLERDKDREKMPKRAENNYIKGCRVPEEATVLSPLWDKDVIRIEKVMTFCIKGTLLWERNTEIWKLRRVFFFPNYLFKNNERRREFKYYIFIQLPILI